MQECLIFRNKCYSYAELFYFVGYLVAACPILQHITSASRKNCFYGFLLWSYLCLEHLRSSREMKFLSLSFVSKLELFSLMS